MPMRLVLALGLTISMATLSACGPLIGAGAVVAADAYSEEERGEDLF